MIAPRIMSLQKRLRRAIADEGGAAMAEFTIAFFLFVMMTMGVMQVAMWAYSASAAQFAVWEGCRAGAAAYQPPPPNGRDPASLRNQHGLSDEYALRAAWAATTRTEQILNWLPITSDYSDLSASIEERDVRPGEEGQRQIVTQVHIEPFVFVPLFEEWLSTDGQGSRLGFNRGCRLRLGRFYSF